MNGVRIRPIIKPRGLRKKHMSLNAALEASPRRHPQRYRHPPSAASPAPKKTVKACQDEWRANRPAYQAARITEKAYVDKCRTGEAVALPSTPGWTAPACGWRTHSITSSAKI